MKVSKWNLDDGMKTVCDLRGYMYAVLEETEGQSDDFFFIACKDVLRIAKKKGWLKRKGLSWLKK